MSAWIGPLGSLIEFKCPSAVESTSDDPHVYFRPLGGDVAVTKLGDGTRPRVWDVSVDAARPDDVAALQALSEGAFGPGPFVFIPPAAETLNLIGKRDALAKGTPPTDYAASAVNAPILTPEGWAGAHYVTTANPPTDRPVGRAPVIPGRMITGKAFVQALTGTTASLVLAFFNSGDTQISRSATVTGTSPTGQYLSVTAPVPSGAVYATLRVAGATITQPQIVWAQGPRTWSPSAASMHVVMSPLSSPVRRATGAPGQEQITDHRFTVTELRA